MPYPHRTDKMGLRRATFQDYLGRNLRAPAPAPPAPPGPCAGPATPAIGPVLSLVLPFQLARLSTRPLILLLPLCLSGRSTVWYCALGTVCQIHPRPDGHVDGISERARHSIQFVLREVQWMRRKLQAHGRERILELGDGLTLTQRSDDWFLHRQLRVTAFIQTNLLNTRPRFRSIALRQSRK